jgi:6-phosphogluconolactonase
MKIIRGSRDESERLAVNAIADSISELLKKQQYIVLGVPGGRSVQGIFSKIAQVKGIHWNRVHLFMVDERIVKINHAESNFRLVNEMLIKPIGKRLPKENVHPFIADKSKPDVGIANYESQLKKYKGRYDIIILGVGEDGHVAALYPNHHSVMSNAEYFLHINDSPKPPAERMTASRNLLMESKVAFALFFSEAKRAAFMNFSKKTISFFSCPAKLIDSVDEAYAVTDLV